MDLQLQFNLRERRIMAITYCTHGQASISDVIKEVKPSPSSRWTAAPASLAAIISAAVALALPLGEASQAHAAANGTAAQLTTQPASQPAQGLRKITGSFWTMGSVDVDPAAKPVVRLRIDPKKLALFKLSVADVCKSLAEDGIQVSGERVDIAGCHEFDLDLGRLQLQPTDILRVHIQMQPGLFVPLGEFAEVVIAARARASTQAAPASAPATKPTSESAAMEEEKLPLSVAWGEAWDVPAFEAVPTKELPDYVLGKKVLDNPSWVDQQGNRHNEQPVLYAGLAGQEKALTALMFRFVQRLGSQPADGRLYQQLVEDLVSRLGAPTAKETADTWPVEFLGRLGARRRLQQMLGQRKDPFDPIGREMLTALSQVGDQRDVPLLIALAGREEQASAALVNTALGHMLAAPPLPPQPNGRTDAAAWQAWWDYRPGKGLLSRAEVAAGQKTSMRKIEFMPEAFAAIIVPDEIGTGEAAIVETSTQPGVPEKRTPISWVISYRLIRYVTLKDVWMGYAQKGCGATIIDARTGREPKPDIGSQGSISAVMAATPANKALLAKAQAIRARFPNAGMKMWEELAELLGPGMTVQDVKAILAPLQFNTMMGTGGSWGYVGSPEKGVSVSVSNAWAAVDRRLPEAAWPIGAKPRVSRIEQGTPATQPVPVASDKAGTRAAGLKKSGNSYFELRPVSIAGIKRLCLYPTDAKGSFPATTEVARISPEQHRAIIDHLAVEGFLDNATSYDMADPQYKGPTIVLRVYWGKGFYDEDLGWNFKMLDRLDGLRKLLEGEPGKAMDKFLAQIKAQRKEWEPAASPATQPTSSQPVTAKAEPRWLGRVREALPRGWSLKRDVRGPGEHWMASRDEPIRVICHSPIAPLPVEPDERTLHITIIAGPKVSFAEYRRMVEFNAALSQKFKGNDGTLRLIAPWSWWEKRTEGEENRPYLLPTHFDDANSYSIYCRPILIGSYEFKSKEDAAEAAGVFAAIAGRFRPHAAPAAASQPRRLN